MIGERTRAGLAAAKKRGADSRIQIGFGYRVIRGATECFQSRDGKEKFAGIGVSGWLDLGDLATMPARRFPPPWSAEVTPNCFIVHDAGGQKLAYVYYESEPGRRSAAKLLSKDEARIAANIAKLRR
jgi:hypothetical protein